MGAGRKAPAGGGKSDYGLFPSGADSEIIDDVPLLPQQDFVFLVSPGDRLDGGFLRGPVRARDPLLHRVGELASAAGESHFTATVNRIGRLDRPRQVPGEISVPNRIDRSHPDEILGAGGEDRVGSRQLGEPLHRHLHHPRHRI